MDRAPVDGEERKARTINALARESAMDKSVRVTPEPPDDEDDD